MCTGDVIWGESPWRLLLLAIVIFQLHFQNVLLTIFHLLVHTSCEVWEGGWALYGPAKHGIPLSSCVLLVPCDHWWLLVKKQFVFVSLGDLGWRQRAQSKVQALERSGIWLGLTVILQEKQDRVALARTWILLFHPLFLKNSLINSWLGWIFAAVYLVAGSGASSSCSASASGGGGFSCCGVRATRCLGFRSCGSRA